MMRPDNDRKDVQDDLRVFDGRGPPVATADDTLATR